MTGVNTISFAIDADTQARKGLLGFAVARADPTEDERFFMFGFKVFKSLVPKPDEVTTFQHPVQSFVWDDFTAKPDRDYTYTFHPLRGKPKNIDRNATPVLITVHTEPLFSTKEHDIFFNRGVASSQAYVRQFGNKKPDDPTLSREEQERAIQWLTRELDEAILRFIRSAQAGDALRCCFYEFRYLPVAQALKKAIDRGVDVRIICDGKDNGAPARRPGVRSAFEGQCHVRARSTEIARCLQVGARGDALPIEHSQPVVGSGEGSWEYADDVRPPCRRRSL
ncbi:hypothetical protein [Luteitalea pratensis]|uniref:hypothetical protein n=1 Tax=Luteitalea pratensis TaxID=1855912 RepID=UPI000D735D13|nr:hypothetical protein [Luteitalea pratensis]